MDWRTFIASVVGSLAWPLVICALLYLLRDDLPALVRRIKNASVAGTKFEFDEALDKLRKETEVAAVEKPREAIDAKQIDNRSLDLAERFPEVAIMESFKVIEEMLLEVRQRLDLPPRSNLHTIVRKLVERNFLDGETETLFRVLQNARNAAVHAGTRIQPGEAIDFMSQARFFQSVLREVLSKIQSPI